MSKKKITHPERSMNASEIDSFDKLLVSLGL